MNLKKWNVLQWTSQSPDFNPNEHAFHLLKTKQKAERPTNKQKLKSAAVKVWKSITIEETQPLVMSISSRLKPVIACKGFSTKYQKLPLYLFAQLDLSPLEIVGLSVNMVVIPKRFVIFLFNPFN